MNGAIVKNQITLGAEQKLQYLKRRFSNVRDLKHFVSALISDCLYIPVCREPPLQQQKPLVTEQNVPGCQGSPKTFQVSEETCKDFHLSENIDVKAFLRGCTPEGKKIPKTLTTLS